MRLMGKNLGLRVDDGENCIPVIERATGLSRLIATFLRQSPYGPGFIYVMELVKRGGKHAVTDI